MKHLSREQMIAFRDEGSKEPSVREHLAACAQCQQRYDDTRWDLSLRRVEEVEGDHPSKDQLLAFWDNALSDPRAVEVQRHVRSCSRCLAVYGRMRETAPEQAYASPQRELLQSVRHSFPPQRARELGDLVLRHVGEAFRLLFRPAEAAFRQSMHVADVEFDALAERSVMGPPHPSSTAARVARLAQSPASRELNADTADDSPPPPKTSNRVVVHADDLRIDLVIIQESLEPVLRVRLAADAGRAARNVALHLDSDRGGRVEARTNRDGRAELRLPEGRSRLVISGRPPVALMLRR